MFVIALPFFHAIIFRHKKSLLFFLIASLISAAIFYFLIFYYAPSAEWFAHYSQKRLMASLNNVGATTDNHFEIIIRIFTELIFPVLIVSILFFTKKSEKTNRDKMVWVLLFTAIAGSFPFAITLEQRGFYLVPSFPFYVLALTLFFRDHLNYFYEKICVLFSYRTVATLSYILLSSSFIYLASSFNIYKRDENLIKDLSVMEIRLPKNDTISILEETWNNVPLHGYLYMHLKTNLEVGKKHFYLIHDRSISEKPESSLYRKLNLPTAQYDLYVIK